MFGGTFDDAFVMECEIGAWLDGLELVLVFLGGLEDGCLFGVILSATDYLGSDGVLCVQCNHLTFGGKSTRKTNNPSQLGGKHITRHLP